MGVVLGKQVQFSHDYWVSSGAAEADSCVRKRQLGWKFGGVFEFGVFQCGLHCTHNRRIAYHSGLPLPQPWSPGRVIPLNIHRHDDWESLRLGNLTPLLSFSFSKWSWSRARFLLWCPSENNSSALQCSGHPGRGRGGEEKHQGLSTFLFHFHNVPRWNSRLIWKDNRNTQWQVLLNYSAKKHW